MLKLSYLRWSSQVEGATLLCLLFIAMPLKYWFGMPMAVKIVGNIHGYAFIAFILIVIIYLLAQKIKIWTSLRLIIGSIIPFGGLINDRWLKSKQTQANASNPPPKW
ncbi:MAG: DUF3817 domain-containing protein [Alphaproteobacteria bacterium]|nr:DUF3817 domain-containing protein [Alphaproteobacteria bacterium]